MLESLRVIFCDEDKKPIGPHGWHSAVTDAPVNAKLERGSYIGVATGKVSGIVVVDIDPRHGGDKTFDEKLSWLPPTRTHRTKSGGRHLIYLYPPEGVRNFNGSPGRFPGIELKSDGYGVVVPPSPGYSVLNDREPAEFPERLRDLFSIVQTAASFFLGKSSTEKKDAASCFHAQPTRDLGTRTSRILKVVQFAKAGDQRNDALYWAACRFGELIAEGLVTAEIAETVLLGAARYNGHESKHGHKQTVDTIHSGLGRTPNTMAEDPTAILGVPMDEILPTPPQEDTP
jgi:hypothetical protein